MVEKSSSLWLKAFDRDTKWEKDDILDVLYWMRQVIALVIGVVLGVAPLTGMIAFFTYIGASSAVIYAYYAKFMKNVAVDDFPSPFTPVGEGFKEAFALFMVSWIFCYSACHFEDEDYLAFDEELI